MFLEGYDMFPVSNFLRDGWVCLFICKNKGGRTKNQRGRTKNQGGWTKGQGDRTKKQGGRIKNPGGRTKNQGGNTKTKILVLKGQGARTIVLTFQIK